MKKKKLVLITLLIFLGLPFSLFAVELKTAAQNSFPKYYKLDNGKMAGLCVDIIQAIQHVNPEIRVDGYQTFLPFKRLQKYLEAGKLNVFFGLKRNETRDKKYIFLDVPLYRLKYIVALRVDDSAKINSFDDFRSHQGHILTVSGSAASRFLHKQGGLIIDDSAQTPVSALKMLMAKRGRFVFYHDLGLRSIIKKEGLEGQIKILQISFLTYDHYAAFSKNTPEETIDLVRIALEKLRESGELAKIHRKYHLLE